MAAKQALTIAQKIALLKQRGMLFKDESAAPHFLENISYYRLAGYWWDMQSDKSNHAFESNTYFEDVVDRYNFDRHLRLILFDAIERIEIALRTSMIYHLSHGHGANWYDDGSLFTDPAKHRTHLSHILQEFSYSQEIFAKDHRRRFGTTNPESWKIMEVVSLGNLSKFYKNLRHQLPEKSQIAKHMGLNIHSELSSWLEAIVYIRNIIAHHSRLWSRSMVKIPVENINNPQGIWLAHPLTPYQKKRAFFIMSCLLYLCNKITPNHQIKIKILDLIKSNPTIPVHKLGFTNQWDQQPIWK